MYIYGSRETGSGGRMRKRSRRLWSQFQKKVTTVSDGSVGKESTCDAGDVGSIPGLGRSPRERNDKPL